MKTYQEKKELNEIEKIKNFLVELGFICNSSPSAQHLIYSKNGEVVIIKNNKKK
jgi:transcription elongation GreA/GreB family factor